jgi:hypothetical protein
MYDVVAATSVCFGHRSGCGHSSTPAGGARTAPTDLVDEFQLRVGGPFILFDSVEVFYWRVAAALAQNVPVVLHGAAQNPGRTTEYIGWREPLFARGGSAGFFFLSPPVRISKKKIHQKSFIQKKKIGREVRSEQRRRRNATILVTHLWGQNEVSLALSGMRAGMSFAVLSKI